VNAGDFRDRLLSRAKSARLTVAAPEVEQLEAYYRLLRRWNRTINLTGLPLEPLCDDTVDRLFIEPLAVASHVPHSSAEWFDLGSGGGSPAIPLKIVRPSLKLTMVEARERKAAFLREVTRDLGLCDAAVVNERFEMLEDRPDFGGVASLVTVRAVRVDSALLNLSRHLLGSRGGRLFLLGARLSHAERAPSTRAPRATISEIVDVFSGEAGEAQRDGFPMFERVEIVELPVGGGSKLVIVTA
jgi:16S rRNA (guanine527-N7)-methyltransferase